MTQRQRVSRHNRIWPSRRGQPKPRIPRAAEERVIERDELGRPLASEFWLRGELVGRALWDEDGLVSAQGLRAGVPVGHQLEYAQGRIQYAVPYAGGVPHGWATQYSSSGRVLIRCRFVHGTGTDFWCDDDGQLSEEHPLVAGKPSGVERWWVDGSAIFDEIHWLEGQWHGPRRSWREGALAPGYPQFFIHGARVPKKLYLLRARTDSRLPPYLPEEDAPERTLPEAFLRFRERARRSARSKARTGGRAKGRS